MSLLHIINQQQRRDMDTVILFHFGRMAIRARLDEHGYAFDIGHHNSVDEIRDTDLLDLKAAIDEALKWIDALVNTDAVN